MRIPPHNPPQIREARRPTPGGGHDQTPYNSEETDCRTRRYNTGNRNRARVDVFYDSLDIKNYESLL